MATQARLPHELYMAIANSSGLQFTQTECRDLMQKVNARACSRQVGHQQCSSSTSKTEGLQHAHGRRDVADAELRLDVRVVELADEGVRPRLAGVDGDVHVVLPVPLPPLLIVFINWVDSNVGSYNVMSHICLALHCGHMQIAENSVSRRRQHPAESTAAASESLRRCLAQVDPQDSVLLERNI